MNDTQALSVTPLDDLHRELGARLVPFAGYAMPVQYRDGIIKEHLHTRGAAGLFDVSHMGQVLVDTPRAAEKLEQLVPADLQGLAIDQQVYTLFTNGEGGVIDDLIITRWGPDRFFLVVNAACKIRDIGHLQQQLGEAAVTVLDERALLAVQGPQAAACIGELLPAAAQLRFMHGCHAPSLGEALGASADDACYITRSGYTGEDGFELSVPAAMAPALARRLLSDQRCRPVGLGARDSLRLEAGLCLYGHELSDAITPVEAGLGWAIGRARRRDGERPGGFPGAEVIFSQQQRGARRYRVGLTVSGKAPVREGAVLLNTEGETIGEVTSGGYGPSVGGPIAMGYVDADYRAVGTAVEAELRKKRVGLTVSRLPWIKPGYAR